MGPTTRAVMPVHLFGLPADMTALEAAIDGHDVAIVEDAAQALGAAVGERAAGSFGLGCFSFYATKNVTTGEGGADHDRRRRARAPPARAPQPGAVRALRVRGAGRERADDRAAGGGRRGADGPVRGHRESPAGERAPRSPSGLCRRRGPRPAVRARGAASRVAPIHGPRRRCWTATGSSNGSGQAGVDAGVYYPRAVYDYACFRADPRVGDVRMPVAEEVPGRCSRCPSTPRSARRTSTRSPPRCAGRSSDPPTSCTQGQSQAVRKIRSPQGCAPAPGRYGRRSDGVTRVPAIRRGL